MQHTAYITRCVRHVALIQLGWLGEDGRDPTIEKRNSASQRFQVSTGQITARLRHSWRLNQILHKLSEREKRDAMTEKQKEEERERVAQKNRGDLRHHAMDAVVIASTLPWLAHRTHGAVDENGNHGWWTQDEKMRSKAADHFDLRVRRDYLKALMDDAEINQHVRRSTHQQAYDTTFYARKRPNCYVVRKELTRLKRGNLRNVYPEEFGAYLQAAWSRYEEDANPDLNGTFPESFTKKLCFSHFQHWRASGTPEFRWSPTVKTPIRSVRVICITDDKAVAKSSPGTNAYVDRTNFKSPLDGGQSQTLA